LSTGNYAVSTLKVSPVGRVEVCCDPVGSVEVCCDLVGREVFHDPVGSVVSALTAREEAAH